MFFALKGDKFDGNQFAAQAIDAGASHAIIDDKSCQSEGTILVEDVLTTLQDLARYHISTLDIPVIGITGSNGKTTSKELLRDVLAKKYSVHATLGNLNNHIGVPLTILSMPAETEIAIIEMGANHLEEIALLSSIAQPNYGFITNIGTAHIGEFGGRDNIIKGKSELYDYLRMSDGMAFVNAEDPLLLRQSQGIRQEHYGKDPNHTVYGTVHKSDPYLSFHLGAESLLVETQLVGDYNFSNAMAAVCIGQHFGVAMDDIREAIQAYSPTNNRSQLKTWRGHRLIMDAYNANLDSMEAALKNLAGMAAEHKGAILGDMLELGEESLNSHRQIHALCQKLGVESIFIGEEFRNALGPDRAYVSTTDATDATRKLLNSADLTLVKGSRGIGLEKLFED